MKFNIADFEKMLDWSKGEFRQLPWRKQRSAYTTLVSEIMLQQTTVKTVEKHYDRFLKQYPDIPSLAKATEEEVQVAWKGLGYYRRARNLLKAAKTIQADYKGLIPKKYDELVEIPGIGDYTASAIVAIGYNNRAIALDANISRVLSRVWGLQLDGLSPLKQNRLIKESFNSHFDTLTSFKKFRDLNESLMDVGRVYCQARKASCSICPLNKKCQAYKSGGVQTEIKTKPKKVSKYFELELGRAIVRNNKQQILMVQKGEGQWLQGQFELPTFTLKSEDQKLDQYDKIKKTTFKQKKSDAVKSSITKYKIMNFYKEVEVGDLLKWLDRKRIPSKMEWMNLDDQRIAHVSQKIIKEYRKKYE